MDKNLEALNSGVYLLTTDESLGDSFVAVPANSMVIANMTNDRSGTIEILKFSETATSDEFQILITERGKNRLLSNQPIHAKCMFGKSGRDFELPFPIYLFSSESLYMEVTDLSGALNTIRLLFASIKYHRPDAKELIYKNIPDAKIAQPFFYTTDSSVTLTALGTMMGYITFLQGAYFKLNRILSHSTGAYKFKLYDVKTSRSLTSGWIHSSMLWNAEYNKLIPYQLIQPGGQYRIEFVDLSGGLNKVYFTLSGINYWEEK